MKFEHLLWHRLIRPLQRMHRAMYARGNTDRLGKIVLLLTTTGRKTGQKRVTPLQFTQFDGDYYVASSRGPRADWFRNLQADPQAEVEVGQAHFKAAARAVTDPCQIADYLQSVIDRYPRMGAAMMFLHHLPARPERAQLESLSSTLALVVLHPAG